MNTLQLLPVGVLILENDTPVFVNDQFKILMGSDPKEEYSLVVDCFKAILSKFTDFTELKTEIKGKHIVIMYKENQLQKIYVITDITTARKLQLAETEEKFKGRLINMFMHEFKTPLNWLNGILSSIITTESTKNLLKMAKHAMNLLNLYIDDISFYDAKGDINSTFLQKKSFSVSKCVNECLSFISAELTINQLKCDLKVPSDFPVSIVGDPNRYKQILNNILCNCVKSCKINEGEVIVALSVNDSKIYTTINDNGIELSQKEIGLLMNPNSNVEFDNLQIRFGIGMLLCREMCKRSRGDLEVSREQMTNKYQFWIPMIKCDSLSEHSYYKRNSLDSDSMSPERKVSKLTSATPYRDSIIDFLDDQKKVMVVDDTPFNNAMLQHMLKLMNVDCISYTNGKEAVDSYEHMSISLILMDVNMPVMDGIEATRLIKLKIKNANSKDVPIVMLSAMEDNKVIGNAYKAGACEYRMMIIQLPSQ